MAGLKLYRKYRIRVKLKDKASLFGYPREVVLDAKTETFYAEVDAHTYYTLVHIAYGNLIPKTVDVSIAGLSDLLKKLKKLDYVEAVEIEELD